ncbi:uncharacterized protein BDR25DRAFT_195517, partial [Lindgomyces ingoldianus]
HLAFRVWQSKSRTKFVDGSFISELLSYWNGPLPHPIAMGSHESFKILAIAHLSLTGNASCWVSVSTSLLQILNYASVMEDPQLAVILLDHPILNEPDKKIHAGHLLGWLKKNGQARWANYK